MFPKLSAALVGCFLRMLNKKDISYKEKLIKVGRLSSRDHSHKKRKDSLEGSLDRVLFAAELEFPKILVARPLQHTSNVNIECARKSEWSKQLYSLYLTSFLEH